MKLRNKKTGRIQEIVVMPVIDGYPDEHELVEGETSLQEFNKVWEDYTPTDPLIKDEKIREAVRAWWECCQEGISDKRVCIINGEFRIGIYRLDLGRHYFFDDKKEGFYTIAELCGEEEAPEPLEPTFVDLDERIKEKEEE